MDHEKPQAVSPQVYEYTGENGEQHTSLVMSDLSPDNEETLYGHTPSINEPDNVEEKRERRGESLWFVLLDARNCSTVADPFIGECLVSDTSM